MKKYLLPLLVLAVLHESFGRLKLWRETISSARLLSKWQLHSTNNADSESGKRSRYNEKMLNDAKKLREQALSMEAQYTAEMNGTAAMPAAANAAQMDTTTAQFVSKFPEARKLAADAVASASRIVRNGAMDETNVTYTSVLTSRDQEAARKSLIGKLSGEVQKEAAKMEEIDDTNDQNSADDIGGAEGAHCTPLALALSTSNDPVSLILPLETASLFCADASNTSSLVLPSLDQFYKSVDSWWLRQLLRFVIGLLLSDVDRKGSPRMLEDGAILEMALALTTLQFGVDFSDALERITGDKTDEAADFAEIFNSIADIEVIRSDAFLRADYIRFRVTGQVPSADFLQEFSGQAGYQSELSEIYHWRVATLERLRASSSSARVQRKLIWNIEPDVDVSTSVDAVAGRIKELNQDLQVINDALEAMQRRSNDNNQANTSNTLSSALMALTQTLNSTYLKMAETNDMLADAVASEQPEGYRGEATTAGQLTVTSTAAGGNVTIDTASRMEDLEGMDITKMTPEQLREYFKPDADGISKMFSMVREKATADVAELEPFTNAAERFIAEYFDGTSRLEGAVISREGAGRFQSEVLRDIGFVTAKVSMFQGACIFEGRYSSLNKSPQEFAEKLASRLQASPMATEVGYTILMNEQYPPLDGSMEQAALDKLLGSSPAVVLFPKSWTTVVNVVMTDPGRRFWRNLIASAGVLTSASFAAGALDMFNPSGPLISTGLFPTDFLSMSMVPLIIHYVSSLVEIIVGKSKGFDVTNIVVPSFTLPTFGSRSIYTTMPANRNDLFDVAAIGIIVPLLLSFLTFAYGLQLTLSAGEAAAAFPTVSLSLLHTNMILSQMLSQTFPDIFQPIIDAAAMADATSASSVILGVATTTATATAAATAAATPTAVVPSVHLHFLAIAGGLSLSAYILQLIPLDNSAGSKLSYSVLGGEAFSILVALFGGLRFLFVLPMLFTLDAAGAVSSKRLLFDYFVTSQLAGSFQENQVAKDNISPISEGRLILYICLVSLFLYSLVPFAEGIRNLAGSFQELTAQLPTL